MTHTYNISGMTCGSCVAKVKNELLKIGDVTNADVQLKSPQATISMSRHIPTAQLQGAVAKAGSFTIADENVHMHHAAVNETDVTDAKASYYPIYLIFGYIAAATLLIQAVSGSFSLMQWMSHFMAGFFLVFSFFKLLNVKGFAEGYQTYDIIARAIPAWGTIYPLVELTLGLLFLSGLFPLGVNIATFVIMGISSIGVIQSLLRKSKFQCACLGTIIKVPLSKVTLVEDMLMVAMSGITIILLTS